MLRRNLSARTSPYLRALCTVSEVVGRAVYISGPKVGDLYQVRLADPTDETKMPSVGIIVQKYSDTECLVQQLGRASGLFAGLALGRYNVQVDGEIDVLAPLAGGMGYAWVQSIGYAIAEDVFYIDPSMDIIIRKP